MLAGIVAELPKPAPRRGPWIADDDIDTTILPWQLDTADVQRATAAALRRQAADDLGADPADDTTTLPPQPQPSTAPSSAAQPAARVRTEVGAVRPAVFDPSTADGPSAGTAGPAAGGSAAQGGLAAAGGLGAGAVPAQRAPEPVRHGVPAADHARPAPRPSPRGPNAAAGGRYGPVHPSPGADDGTGTRYGSGARRPAAEDDFRSPSDRPAGVEPSTAPHRAVGQSWTGGHGSGRAGEPASSVVPAQRTSARRRVLVVTTGAVVAVGVAGYGWTSWGGLPQRGDGAALAAGATRTCFVTYAVLSDKDEKFTAGVLITNNSSQPARDWRLRFVMPGDQRVAGGGGFTLTQQGHDVTAGSTAVIEPLRTTQLKLTGRYRQSNPVPMLFTLNGRLCEALVSPKPGDEAALVPNLPGTTVNGGGFPVPPPNVVPSLSTGPNGVVTVTVPPTRTAGPTSRPVTVDPTPLVTPTTTTPPPPSPPSVDEPTPSASTESEEPPPPPPPPPPLDEEPPADQGLFDSLIGYLA
ncbi:MAG TPA: cellulose binding domain-containing protein [Actinoplanes sp.]|nr:cellulose binding domain-containing protein [Actinoplanes sp.]